MFILVRECECACAFVRVCVCICVRPCVCLCEFERFICAPDASVSKMNGLVKLGKASIGVSVSSLLSSSNACWQCSA